MGLVLVERRGLPELGDELSGAALGDARRSERLKQIVQAMGLAPDKSLPDIFKSEAELAAAYRFVGCYLSGKTGERHVSPDKILAPHHSAIRRRAEEVGSVIVAHDTTEFQFGGEVCREGLGWVDGGGHGFYSHQSLVVSADGAARPLGVVAIHNWTREAPEPGERRKWRERYEDPDKESLRWLAGVRLAEERLRGTAEVIHVMDRESDAYHLLAKLVGSHRFVSRIYRERICLAKDFERQAATVRCKLSQLLGTAEDVLVREVPLSKRGAKVGGRTRSPKDQKKHPPRNSRFAILKAAAMSVTLRRPDDAGEDLPALLRLNVVRVHEVDPPVGEEPVEWWLATTEPIDTPAQVAAIIDAYRSRWRIEELFLATKTGCAYEGRQLETYEALQNLLAVTLPVAWRLLLLRQVGRDHPNAPATAVLSERQIRLLRAVSVRVKLSVEPTAGEVMLAVAGLGGHLKRNGQPGWRVLWRGFSKLLHMEQGWVARDTDRRCVES